MLPSNSRINSEAPERARGPSIAQSSACTPPRFIAESLFHFTGGSDIALTAQPKETPTARVRSTLTIARDRESMTALWERSDDGISWHPWMDIHFSLVDDTSGSHFSRTIT
jgi:hypothetical protein